MRSQKLLIVSATMLASTTLASLSFADNTSAAPPPVTTGTTGTTSTTSSPSGSSSTTSSTVMTPSSPSVPTTSTTTTTQGTAQPAVPTSTTTTTSADDALPTTPNVPVTSPPSEPSRDTTLYDRRRPNKALLITGGSLLVGTYATTAALTAANGPTADKDLYIPVVGPWINLADRGNDRTDATRDGILIAGSGVLQGIGAIMAVSSFFVPEKVPTARISAGNVKMNITPTAGPGAGGIGAIGTF